MSDDIGKSVEHYPCSFHFHFVAFVAKNTNDDKVV